MVRWKRDVLVSVFFIVFCIVNFIYAGTMTTSTIKIKAAMPDVYLRMWLVLLGILAVIVLIKALKDKPDEMLVPIWGKLQLFTIAAVAVYLLIMPYLGFFISTFVFLAAMIIVYSLNMGKEKKKGSALVKQMAFYLIFTLIVTFLTEELFRNILGVILPSFSLF